MTQGPTQLDGLDAHSETDGRHGETALTIAGSPSDTMSIRFVIDAPKGGVDASSTPYSMIYAFAHLHSSKNCSKCSRLIRAYSFDEADRSRQLHRRGVGDHRHLRSVARHSRPRFGRPFQRRPPELHRQHEQARTDLCARMQHQQFVQIVRSTGD